MKRLLEESELEKLSADIAEQLGLHFPPSKWKTLEQAFATLAREQGFQDIHDCVAQFTSGPPGKEMIESLAGYLTIAETYFLREAQYFNILEQQIIPEIVRKRQGGERRLRIWSAGCATGEEPYSIAILLHRMRTTLSNWEISILATDINPNSLAKAREGVYTNWSFRNVPDGFQQAYFRNTGDGQFELRPEIREMVKFAGCNLVEDCYPSLINDTNAIDVIFCRNVLMYLTPQIAARIVARFQRCLLDGGWLFVSPCETANPFFIGLEPINFPNAIIYRKGSGMKSDHQGNKAISIPTPPLKPLPAYRPIQLAAPSPALPRTGAASPPPSRPHPGDHCETPPLQEAFTLYEQGAYEEAAEKVALQLVLNSRDSRALALLCRIYANQGRLTEALQMSDQALAGDKLSAGLHYLRAVILLEQGKDEESAAALKKALYLDQDLVLAHFTLANLEQRKGQLKESQRYFDTALSLLDRYQPDDLIPESDGMSAGRLKEIIGTTTSRLQQGDQG
ncbi:chemotaxis protein methyltransferase [Geobacter sp. OR-1]|uniref:CheR family methyltransferase n=1 Tax=Geobacter sp. OR-1 TaxID=1266765 RepID=UPI000541F4BA|nr:protein-glutamate O-methyltransferase CheR [Geobacter sp. OR-1]GAM10256.1 chemotaxis protein methyltransferase [Geobacter sp. OR-1]